MSAHMTSNTLPAALRAAISPAAFAEACGLTLDPWQVEVAASASPRVLLNCSRQSGKSTVTAVLAAHQAIFTPGSLTLMVSATQRQSGELFRKALTIYRKLGRPLPARAESALHLELSNGARIIALPGTEGSIRSYSGVDLLLLDEASRIGDATYASVRPMLAVSGGRLIALSTPFGTRGWWWEAWRGCDEDEAAGRRPEWARWRIPAEQCPRISAAFLASERAQIGEWWYRQEYGCDFLDSKTAAFRAEDIARAFAEDYDVWSLPGLGGAPAADTPARSPAGSAAPSAASMANTESTDAPPPPPASPLSIVAAAQAAAERGEWRVGWAADIPAVERWSHWEHEDDPAGLGQALARGAFDRQQKESNRR